IPCSNLTEDDDVPEFEPFDVSDVRPRGRDGDQLTVVKVDMCQHVNKRNHHTVAYDTLNLVVRRGAEFSVCVTFSRPLAEGDDFQLELMIGQTPSVHKGSLVVVTFNSRRGSRWAGRVAEKRGEEVVLGITPTPDAIVGKYRVYVCVVGRNGLQRTRRDTSTDLYLLFNAWCSDDTVFLPDEVEREEYVLNDYGVIYQGSCDYITQRNWVFGQFERGILDACIYVLDASRMRIDSRGNAVKLVRTVSGMMNSLDDNGVLVGNWSDDFSMGTAPMLWTGSVKILLQYAATGNPVCFAQCWVFAAIFNTFLRCLGIPARVVTNFNSAHDNTGNLKTELIFKSDGTLDRRNTRDSIWNYHCWNEVFVARPDLPPGLGGWQVVDATPQETSDGHFRCGPASVAAIKDGLLCHQFDTGFCFAEVNSDVVFLKVDRYGTMTPFRVDKFHIGKTVVTKATGMDVLLDITRLYKHEEGSLEDRQTMQRAEEYGCMRDHSEPPDTKVSVSITAKQVFLGQSVSVTLEFQNRSDVTKTLQARFTASVVFYTGVTSAVITDRHVSVSVPAFQ
ncbi:hypothetical protein LDENG_00087100, partial [Lucifuga dentata]